jgi:hypothetical protein
VAPRPGEPRVEPAPAANRAADGEPGARGVRTGACGEFGRGTQGAARHLRARHRRLDPIRHHRRGDPACGRLRGRGVHARAAAGAGGAGRGHRARGVAPKRAPTADCRRRRRHAGRGARGPRRPGRGRHAWRGASSQSDRRQRAAGAPREPGHDGGRAPGHCAVGQSGGAAHGR